MAHKAQPQGLFDGKIIAAAAIDAVRKLDSRALAKNPDARFDSGAQMAAALDDCRSRLPSGQP